MTIDVCARGRRGAALRGRRRRPRLRSGRGRPRGGPAEHGRPDRRARRRAGDPLGAGPGHVGRSAGYRCGTPDRTGGPQDSDDGARTGCRPARRACRGRAPSAAIRGLLALAVLARARRRGGAGHGGAGRTHRDGLPAARRAVGLDDARVLVPADQPGVAGRCRDCRASTDAWTTARGWRVWPARRSRTSRSAPAATSRPAWCGPSSSPVARPDPPPPTRCWSASRVARALRRRRRGRAPARLLTLSPDRQVRRRLRHSPTGPAVTAGGRHRPDARRGAGRCPTPGRRTPLRPRLRADGSAVRGVRPRRRAGVRPAFADAYRATAARRTASIAAQYLPPDVELPTTEVDPSVARGGGRHRRRPGRLRRGRGRLAGCWWSGRGCCATTARGGPRSAWSARWA